MEYFAMFPTIGTTEILSLLEIEVNKIKEDYTYLCKVNSIEDIFDVLMENYLELEELFINISLRDSIFFHFDIIKSHEVRRTIDRKFINFTSTCRMYFDQINRILSSINADYWNEFKQMKKRQSANSFSFRLMEYLRNAIQHNLFPFGYTLDTSREETTGGKRIIHSFVLFLNVAEIRADLKRHKSLLSEVINISDKKLPLNKHIRNYITSICDLHNILRDKLKTNYKKSKESLEDVFSQYSRINPNYKTHSYNYLSIFQKDEHKQTIELFTIGDICTKNCEYLLKKSSLLSNIGIRIVTSDFD